MSRSTEKRKYPRRALWYPAEIDFGDGSEARDCQLRDISVSGARLKVETIQDLPDKFTLLLAKIGKPRRRCRVAWRTETEAGVEFVTEP